MKVTFNVMAKFTVTFDSEKETTEGLKTPSQYAQDLAEVVCDEVVNAGGVASYDIIESSLLVE